MRIKKLKIGFENCERVFFNENEIKDIQISNTTTDEMTDYIYLQIRECADDRFYRLMRYNDIVLIEITDIDDNIHTINPIQYTDKEFSRRIGNIYQSSFFGENNCLNMVISKNKNAKEVFKGIKEINKFDKTKIRLTEDQINILKHLLKFSNDISLDSSDKSISIPLDVDQFIELKKENLQLFI